MPYVPYWDPEEPPYSTAPLTIQVHPLNANARPVGFAAWPEQPEKKKKKRKKRSKGRKGGAAA